jgi:hypothetical protein
LHGNALAVSDARSALAPLNRCLADPEFAFVNSLIVGNEQRDAVVAKLRLDVSN